ncbi:hypothetical protein OGAPHI_005959 [Ogataea philodendri]|uniref:Uncharacterized protein n=1 Tax=Ogataea philodendri TaxID=1378263 RepID=A0A9P8NYW2_9ASCO|nr:uncharacterized protein OGAPHI_005959 [Ogataea philodendri]KAH3661781.1 hypothetical protein OGAPHI_005959 [Ogataea philodendri]
MGTLAFAMVSTLIPSLLFLMYDDSWYNEDRLSDAFSKTTNGIVTSLDLFGGWRNVFDEIFDLHSQPVTYLDLLGMVVVADPGISWIVVSCLEIERFCMVNGLVVAELKQIEHALAAVKQGVTSLGIKATNGIVLATERKSSSVLVQSDFVDKIVNITPDIGMTYAGMGPDFRVLTDKSRKVAHTNYKRIYNENPPTKILVSEVAKIMQDATQSAGVRPYGVSLLLGGYDENNGFMLYQVDPSGSYFPWKATAIGKGSNAAKTFLEKRWNEELELEDAIHIALLTLKESIEGEMNGDTVEISVIGSENVDLLGFQGVSNVSGPRFRKLSKQEINDRLETL